MFYTLATYLIIGICLALLVIDWRQTLYMAACVPPRREVNIFLRWAVANNKRSIIHCYFFFWVAVTFSAFWWPFLLMLLGAVILLGFQCWAVPSNLRKGIPLW